MALYSDPYDIDQSLEENIKDYSEKELSQANKSHPDDKIVDLPKVIRPPRPNIKPLASPLPPNPQRGADRTRSLEKPPLQQPKNVPRVPENENIKVVSSDKKKPPKPFNRSFGATSKPKIEQKKGQSVYRSNSVKKSYNVSFKETLDYEEDNYNNNPEKYEYYQDGEEDDEEEQVRDFHSEISKTSNPKRGLKPMVHTLQTEESDMRNQNNVVNSNSNHNNDALYNKMADKIREQAKRIILMQKQLLDANIASNGNNGASGHQLALKNKEIDKLSTKNELLEKQVKMLNQKASMLQKIVDNSKGKSVDNGSYFEDGEYEDQINNLANQNIELEEVLKQESIKNEKLISMNNLLKKISEEKLEKFGFKSVGDMSRVETLFDAQEVYARNEELQTKYEDLEMNLEEKEQEIKVLDGVIEKLKDRFSSMVETQHKLQERIVALHEQETKSIEKVKNKKK